MRFVFRADASEISGSGHVMRCSAIAEELISRGENVIFIGSTSQLPWVSRHISNLGFSAIFQNSQSFIPESNSDVLILDTYEIPLDEKFIHASNWHRIVLIADEKTPAYYNDLKVLPGLKTDLHGDANTMCVAGPKFIPLRKSLRVNPQNHETAQGPLKILVVAGGSDPYDAVEMIASALCELQVDIDVMLFLKSMTSLALDVRFKQQIIGSGLDQAIRSVGLIITTSSTSSLEFISLGFPVGVVCAVENQRHNYDYLGQLNVAAQLGIRSDLTGWSLDKISLMRLVEDGGYRNMLVKNSKEFFDIRGAERIVDAIQSIV
jgi:spore coat polysaccharide biosynthesis predicted glycosyltransferase SpsG